jgi:hypothetical protein
MGAERVIAIEGRREFETQWHEIKHNVFGINPQNITWHTMDVRDYIPNNEHTIISCLGLIYHMAEPWSMLMGLITENTKHVLIESQISEKSGKKTDVRSDRTRSLKPETHDYYDIFDAESEMAKYFEGWRGERVYFYGFTHLNTTPDDTGKIDLEYINPAFRALWLLSRVS